MTAASRSVLIVDDEPQVRQLAMRALAETGFRCDEAGDGEEALRRVAATPFDAVVTDLRMPMRHGHALCGDLLKLPRPPQVMVLTGISDARLVRDLMSRGVREVVQKPVAYDVLATKVAAMIATAAAKPDAKPNVSGRGAAKFGLLQQIETMLHELTDLCGDRLDDVFTSTDDLPDPPRAVRDCIRRLAEQEATTADPDTPFSSHEGRRHERVTCFTTVTAVPVDRKWRRTCEPFRLALRDLSESGLRLLYTRATSAEYLALSWNATRLPNTQIRVVSRVMRVKPCSPFYDFGGQFVMSD